MNSENTDMTSNPRTCRVDGCNRKPAYGASVCTAHTSHGRKSDPAKRYQPTPRKLT